MSAIHIMTLLVLMGTDILPSEVHAGYSRNSGSRGSKDNDATYCKTALPYKKTIEDKINYLVAKKQPLPTCKCGNSGTISKIEILDGSSGKTMSLVTCCGCTGPHVPVQSDAECCNIADIFRPDLDTFCQIVRLRCKNVTVYRCGSPAVSTTAARTTPRSSTTTLKAAPTTGTSATLQTTTSATPLPTTTNGNSPANTPTVTQLQTTTSATPLPTTANGNPPDFTTTPLQTTTGAAPLPTTTNIIPTARTISPTPILGPGYGYDY